MYGRRLILLQKLFSKENDRWTLPFLSLLLSVLGFALYGGYLTKAAGVLAGVWLVWLLATSDLRALRSPFVWPLAGYVVFAALTAIWAMSGKFFLREYLKVFLGAAICFTLLLKRRFDDDIARRAMSLVAGTATVYAFLNVEIATFGFTRTLFAALVPNGLSDNAGSTGLRLSGVFDNLNLEAALSTVGVIFSLALLCRAAEKRERAVYALALSFNAFALLMGFSMGALACFAVAIVLYLVFADEGRMAAFARMLEAALPTIASAMVSYILFSRGGSAAKAVLLVLLLNAAVTVLLELALAPRLVAALNAHKRAAVCFLAGAVALLVLYVALGLSIHNAYTFGEKISRQIHLAPGEHTLLVDTDGEVSVSIGSRNRVSVIIRGGDNLYTGADRQIAFTVPDDSEIVVVSFSAESGVTLSSAIIDGATELPLTYPLLPGFVAERMQGIRASRSAAERFVFMEDALKLWKLSPIVGSGLGAFECGYPRVQEFPYQTRYVHSHYFQALPETGVIGLALWIAALVAMVAALWRKRKAVDSPYRWCYAALWAALAMTALQSAWDASLSFLPFVLTAYTLFGLILRICAVEPAEVAAPEQTKKRKKGGASQKREVSLVRVAAVLFPAVFTLTLLGNIWAQRLLVNSFQSQSYEDFFSKVDLAMRLDAFEYNDAKLSYIQSAAYNHNVLPESVLTRADAYATELSKAQSNSIPQALTAYYLTMAQYEKAIDAAKLAAVYSASSASVWNETASLLREAFSANYYALLLKDAAPYVHELLEYHALLDAHNEGVLVPVALKPGNEDFFTRVARLVPYPEDNPTRVFELLSAE